MTRRTVLLACCLALGMALRDCPAGRSADAPMPMPTEMTVDGLTVAAVGSELHVVPVQTGGPVFLNRDYKLGEDDYVYPAELDGLPRLLCEYFKYTRRPIRFQLSHPARMYAWIKCHQETTVNDEELAKWRLYRRDLTAKVSLYYRDFPAGQNTIVLESSQFASAGIRALTHLSEREKLVPVARTVDGRPVLQVGFFGDQAEDVPCVVRLAIAGTDTVLHEAERTIRVLPGQIVDVPIDMTTMPEGVLHVLTATVRRGDDEWTCHVPCGVFPSPPPDASVQEPFFPYGGYDKTMQCVSEDPEIRGVYLRGTFYRMRKAHMNTLVVGPPRKFELDLAAEYGMRCVVRVSGQRQESKELIEHPSVLAAMIGDEPRMEEIESYKERYGTFRAQFKTPILTCTVMDGYGSHAENDPLRVWPVLKPAIRMGRLYAFRKTQYDLLHPVEYNGWMAPTSIFRSVENDPGPWWLVPPFFGHEGDVPFWRIPTGLELRGLLHLAVAHRCTGLLGWSLHDHFGKIFTVFLDGATLAPTEHSQLDALRQFGAELMQAKPILARFSPVRVGVYYRSTHEVEVAGRWTRDGQVGVYAVNINTRESRDCEMQVCLGRGGDGKKNLAALHSVREVFSGASIPFETEVSTKPIYGLVRFRLEGIAPGDARLVLLEGDFPAVPEQVTAGNA